MRALVLKWFCFSGCVSLLPLLFSAVGLMNHGKLAYVGLIWERGEFLLISVTLLISAIGDLVASKNTKMIQAKTVVGAICMFFALGLCAWYGSIVESLISNQSYAKHAVGVYSPWLFLFSLISSLACVMLSHETEL